MGVGIRILSCCLGRWAGESVGARPLTCEMYQLFVSWGLIDSFVSIPIMVVSYKFILIFVLTVPSSTFDRFCVGVVPAVLYFLSRVEVVRICDDLDYFVLKLLALCCTGQVLFFSP